MPVSPTYPGVYVEEIPSGVRTIVGVPTSVAAFIGRAKRGPTDEAITINGYADFERTFGGLWQESRLGFAVRDFFQNGGGQAVIVRLFHPLSLPQPELDAIRAVAEAGKTGLAAVNPLTAESVAAAIVVATNAATGVPAEPANVKAKAQEALNTFKTAAQTQVGKPLEGAKTAIDAAINAAISELTPSSNAKIELGKDKKLILKATYPGIWGAKLHARVDTDGIREVPSGFDSFGLVVGDLFNLTIRDMTTGATELHHNLSVKAGPRHVTAVLENESRLVRAVSVPSDAPEANDKVINDGVDTPDVKAKKMKVVPFSDQDTNIRTTGASGGNDGGDLKEEDFTTGEGKEANRQGLFALEQLFARDALFNILCIPPYKDLESGGGDVDPSLIAAADAYCLKRRAMLIVDPPSKWKSKDDARNGFSGDFPGIRSKNAALFFPRLKQPNPLKDNQFEEFVPCGVVAGIFARTDVQRGVWKAPAGIEATLSGVPALTAPLTDQENGELNPLGINCLRTFPTAGKVIWGSRTLRGADQLADEYKYIPVRRTALFIEESLFRGLSWVVFEPNDEPLWAQIRLNVGAFMHNLFRQGAFQGTTPRDAYFVKCNKETTTQNDINLGIVNVIVGFAPLKPAEFVIVKLQQMAGQIEV